MGKVKHTPSGGVRVPAAVTRTGIFIYRRQDGSEIRELRPAEEVFHRDSLATLAGAPVTDLHPSEPVTPANWKQLSIGHVEGAARQDGKFVQAELAVQTAEAIQKIDSRELEELSCGYTCSVDETPGMWQGQRYDSIQRNIRYNHVALGPRGWGRAGNEVALRLDSGDAIQVSAVSPPESKVMKVIKIDGREYEYGSEAHIAVIESTASDKVKAAEARADAAEAKLDVAVKEKDELQARLDVASDPKALDARVQARADLLDRARKACPSLVSEGKSDRDIMVEAIRADASDFDAEGKSDDYVRAYFEATTRNGRTSPVTAARTAAVNARREDGQPAKETGMAAARARMTADNKAAHLKPLRFSRTA